MIQIRVAMSDNAVLIQDGVFFTANVASETNAKNMNKRMDWRCVNREIDDFIKVTSNSIFVRQRVTGCRHKPISCSYQNGCKVHKSRVFYSCITMTTRPFPILKTTQRMGKGDIHGLTASRIYSTNAY